MFASKISEALSWLHHLNMQNIIVELDCKEEVDVVMCISPNNIDLRHYQK